MFLFVLLLKAGPQNIGQNQAKQSLINLSLRQQKNF